MSFFPTQPRLPLALKLVVSLWMLAWVPIYWHTNGPANFLWLCDLANFLVFFGLWLESALLLSAQALGVLAIHLLWMLDFSSRLLVGAHLIGGTEYMFDPTQALVVRLFSASFHVATVPLLLWVLWRLGYDRRAFLLQTAITWVLFPLTFLLTDPALNVNWLWKPFGVPQTVLPPPLLVVVAMLVIPLVLYLPTHLLFRFLAARHRRLAPVLSALVVALSLLLGPGGATAQSSEPDPTRPKIGLALSGGGARGLAHIGVLKVLEENRIPVDYVAGTSMGAIVGGLYAAGLSPERLEKVFLTQDWDDLLDDRAPYRNLVYRRKEDRRRYPVPLELGLRKGKVLFSIGLRAGQNLGLKLRSLLLPMAAITDFSKLPTPFKAVAADITTGEAVVLDHGNLAEALRASMAIPGVFTPIELEGRLLVDGGIANNLPVDVVRAMGADVVIAVNLSEPLAKREELGSLLGITYQMLSLLTHKTIEPQLAAADHVLQPQVDDFGVLSFAEPEPLIQLGEKETESHLAELEPYRLSPEAYARYLAGRPDTTVGPPEPIAFIRIEGQKGIDERVLQAQINTAVGDPLEAAALEQDLAHLFGMEDFQLACFERVEEDGRPGLIYQLDEKAWGPGYLRFGLEALSDLQGDTTLSAVVNYTRKRLNLHGAEWRNDLRLGRRQTVFSELYLPIDYAGRWFFAPRGEIDVGFQGLFENGHKIGEYETRFYAVGADLGRRLGRLGELRLGLVSGRQEASVSTGAATLPTFDVPVGSLRARLATDTTDNPTLASQGARIEVVAELSRTSLGAEDDYDRLGAHLTGLKSWGENTWLLGFDAGTSLGSELPTYAEFLAGGLLSLGGYGEGELRGQRFAIGRLGYRRQLLRLPSAIGQGVYAALVLESGNVWGLGEEVDFDDLRWSATGLIGADTLVGPVFFGYGLTEGGDGRFYFTIGRGF